MLFSDAPPATQFVATALFSLIVAVAVIAGLIWVSRTPKDDQPAAESEVDQEATRPEPAWGDLTTTPPAVQVCDPDMPEPEIDGWVGAELQPDELDDFRRVNRAFKAMVLAHPETAQRLRDEWHRLEGIS